MRPSARSRTRLGLVAPAAFLGGSAAWIAIGGVPTSRELIGAWVIVGLLAFTLNDIGGWARGVVVDLLPFFAMLVFYDLLRGRADGLFSGAHYLPQLRADEALFGGTSPTVGLQHMLHRTGHVRWWDVVSWGVYVTHFFATPVLAAVLWKIDRARFRRFTAIVATLAFAGFVTYALYPAAPPWLAAEKGYLPHVTRIVPEVWRSIGATEAHKLVERGYRFANDVAAVPSLHAGFALLIALFLWPRRRRLGALVLIYPLAMGLALVYSGEHYVVDVLLGWLYALGAVLAVRSVVARRRMVPVALTAAAPGVAAELP